MMNQVYFIYKKYFTFYGYHNIKDFVDKRSPDSNANHLNDCKDRLVEFYYFLYSRNYTR